MTWTSGLKQHLGKRLKSKVSFLLLGDGEALRRKIHTALSGCTVHKYLMTDCLLKNLILELEVGFFFYSFALWAHLGEPTTQLPN